MPTTIRGSAVIDRNVGELLLGQAPLRSIQNRRQRLLASVAKTYRMIAQAPRLHTAAPSVGKGFGRLILGQASASASKRARQ